jgi:hypothetical protein
MQNAIHIHGITHIRVLIGEEKVFRRKTRSLPRNLGKKVLLKKRRNRKIDFEEIPFTTIRITIHALRWIFFLIFIYIGISIVVLLIQGGNESIKNIIVYSVTGFFTFFMGYFGWMFARSVMEIVSGKKPKKDDF